MCGAEGPLNDPVTNGERCGDGLCYEATCHAGCVPSNPAACGTEGANEPTNDAGASATSYGEGSEECGMLDADDIDWYTMYLEDEDLESDVMGFELHSTAASLELCAYVRCNNNGFPEGGCANKENGPQGSIGCCWQGNAADLSPEWDLDCQDTSEDSGTLYFSVRAPTGDDCEGYTVSAHY